jgi:hypothetical protein
MSFIAHDSGNRSRKTEVKNMEEKIMEFNQLKNGDAKTNTGIKELAFDSETLEIRPVLFRIYSGYSPSRGTVQGVREGDIIAQCIWNSKSTDYRIYRYGLDDIDLNKQAELWISLREKHPWIDSWLEPSGRGETNIPEEIIPVKNYLSNKIKRARIENALSRFGISGLSVEDFMLSKKKDLQVTPKKLDLNLDEYQPTEKHWTGSLVDIHTSETWYGSTGTGKPATELEIDPEYESGSNYAHTETKRKDGTPGIKGWQKWKYIVRIVHGCYEKDHSSYGKSFHVWENVNFQSVKKNNNKAQK